LLLSLVSGCTCLPDGIPQRRGVGEDRVDLAEVRREAAEVGATYVPSSCDG
jgi:hypothetical protein